MTCQLDAEAGVVYNLFHANRKAETRSQGFSDTIYFLSGSFRSEERANNFGTYSNATSPARST